MGTINLRSSVARDRAPIPLLGATPPSGRLELRPVRNGLPITVDGLILQPH